MNKSTLYDLGLVGSVRVVDYDDNEKTLRQVRPPLTLQGLDGCVLVYHDKFGHLIKIATKPGKELK